MGLREPFMVKQVFTNADLELEAGTGKSLLVKDIIITNPAANYLTVKVEKTSVGYFRVGGNLGNHLGMPMGSVKHSHSIKVAAADGALAQDHALTDALGVSNAHLAVFSDRAALTEEPNAVLYGSIPHSGYETLLGFLRRLGLFKGFPIAEGQKMTFSGVKQAGCLQMVIYEEHDAGDIKKEMPNGSEAKEYLFINYGRVAAAITTSTSTIFSVVQTPAEFPDFPFGKDVPAGYEIDILGILGSDVVDDRSGGDCMNTDYIKMVRERVTLFDDDKNGIFFKGIIGTTDGTAQFARGYSLIGNHSDVDQKPPLLFSPPLVFKSGEELGVYVVTTAGAAQNLSDLAAADLELGLIQRVRRVA